MLGNRLENEYNIAITKYYELQNRKLELEIKLLENKLKGNEK